MPPHHGPAAKFRAGRAAADIGCMLKAHPPSRSPSFGEIVPQPTYHAVIPAFHHSLRVSDTDAETTRKNVDDFLAAIQGVNSAIEVFNSCHEAAIVEFTDCRVVPEAIESLIEAARHTEHIVWVVQVEGTMPITALSSRLGGNLPVPENLCLAIRPPKDLTSEQLVMEAFAQCPTHYKALHVDGESMPDFAKWKSAGANWIILAAGVAPNVRELIRTNCFSAILPLLELGSDVSIPQLRSHPFPRNWDVDFSSAGVPTGPMDVVAGAETRAKAERFQSLDSQIRHGIKASVAAGFSLLEIHDNELWRGGGYKSWNDYCGSLLETSRSHVNRLIAHARITEEIRSCNPPTHGNGIVILPANESQSRPLKKLKSTKIRAKAWHLAVKSAAGTMPTARMVSEVVASLADTETSGKSKIPSQARCRQWIEGLRSAAQHCGSRDHALQLLEKLEKTILTNPTNQQ